VKRFATGAHRVPRIDISSLRTSSEELTSLPCSNAVVRAGFSINPHWRWQSAFLQHHAGLSNAGSRGEYFRLLPFGPPDQDEALVALQTTHCLGGSSPACPVTTSSSSSSSDIDQ
jgi:hypothetical protein